jgi:chorismate--pyruvate lyase
MTHQNKWHKNLNFELPSKLIAWLQHVDSFMERLNTYGIMDAKIQVIHESWQIPHTDEKQLLKVSEETFIREVWITSPSKCWMFARTVIPRTFLRGQLVNLLDLKTRPIGSVLFNDKNIKRSDFEFICLDSNCELYEKIQKYRTDTPTFARRSLFSANQASLLLTEVFMPDILTL